MRRIALLAFAAATVSTPALANPVLAEMLRARQIPHTQHVQVTYARMYSSDAASAGPLSRDTTALGRTWMPFAAGVNLNGGSGVQKYATALQICDCDVPIGSHSYSALPSYGTYAMTVNVTVVDNMGEPDAAVVKPDAMPWDIPDPVEIQGIDCVKWCASAADSGTTPADASTIPVDSSAAPVDSSIAPVDSSIAPVDSSIAPVDSSIAPVDSGIAPVDSSATADVSQPAPQADASSPSTAPTSTAPTAAAPDNSSGGGGCSIGARSGSGAALFLIGCSLWLMRRRKRAR
jgi:hypothetical protein